MCDICDGKTYEEAYQNMRGHIGGGRWSLQGVEPGPTTAGWLYTVGLIENFDHPELLLAGGDLDANAEVLNWLGDNIARGLRVDTDEVFRVSESYVVEFENVHPSYLMHGLCNSWDNYYNWVGSRPGPLHVLQVVLPLTKQCDHCDRQRRCFATPGAPGFGNGLNRAERRANARRRGSRN